MRHTYLKNVNTLRLSQEKCTGCGTCTEVCPHGVFRISNGKAVLHNRNACMECGACARNCATKAVSVVAGVGCANAVIIGWLTGSEPQCGCSENASCC